MSIRQACKLSLRQAVMLLSDWHGMLPLPLLASAWIQASRGSRLWGKAYCGSGTALFALAPGMAKLQSDAKSAETS